MSKVEIINYTPEPERIVASSARISSTKGTATEIYEKSATTENEKLVNGVIKLGHVTTAEHAVFNLAFECSVVVEQMLIEARLASFTIKSRRYVQYSDMGFVGAGKFGDDYDKHVKYLFGQYDKLIDLGVEKEDARFILPYAMMSHIYCTVNARQMMKIIYMLTKSNLPEAISLGDDLYNKAMEIMPSVFQNTFTVEKDSKNKAKSMAEILDGVSILDEESENVVDLICSPANTDEAVAVIAIMNELGCDDEKAWGLLQDLNEFDVIDSVLDSRRPRELEQVNFTFRFNSISLATLTHLTRHRMQALIVPGIETFHEAYEIVAPNFKSLKALQIYYETSEVNREFIKKKKGIMLSSELAYLALAGYKIPVISTMNARELLHFLRLRTCTRAQWEIRDIAIEMLRQLRSESYLFSSFGPSCFMDGKCPEGRMCCGRQDEMKRDFGNE